MKLRQKIFDIIDRDNKHLHSRMYDWFMLVMILASLVPLMTVNERPIFRIIELVTVTAFIIDYLLRWYSAPVSMNITRHSRGEKSISPLEAYLTYPFTVMAIIDLLTILPVFNLFNPSLKVLRITRLAKTIRLLKVFRYSKEITIFAEVLYRQRRVLMSVLMLALFYIFLMALIMFNCEPHVNPYTGEPTFTSFLDALYWSTVTLTTVGYGDLTPVTDTGRIISMISAIFGVVIIALPSGVVTAGYMEAIAANRRRKRARTSTESSN